MRSVFGLELKWLFGAGLVWFAPRGGAVALRQQEERLYWMLWEQGSDWAGSHCWTGTEEAESFGMAVVGVEEEEVVEGEEPEQAVWVLDWTVGSAVILLVSGS